MQGARADARTPGSDGRDGGCVCCVEAVHPCLTIPRPPVFVYRTPTGQLGAVEARGQYSDACMRPIILALLMSAVVAATLAPSADAAVKSKVNYDVRLTLEGRELTAKILDRPNRTRIPPIRRELFGKRTRAACGTSFRRPRRSNLVTTVHRWPSGATSVSFHFDRDLSRRAKWCLIESAGPDGGADLAFVSFLRGEPGRLLGKGRGPSGRWWRLSGRRSARLEPCTSLRTVDGAFGQCFSDDAETEAKLAVVVYRPSCQADTFVYGATARSVKSVNLTLTNGTSVEATLYRRPLGSRVRAQYYLAVLPGFTPVSAVEARDADGRLVGREAERWLEPMRFPTPSCDVAIPD